MSLQSDVMDTDTWKPSKRMLPAVEIDYIKGLESQRDAAVEEVEKLGNKMKSWSLEEERFKRLSVMCIRHD